MTKRVEILASFRGDPNETGHAETYFREGQYADVPEAYADLLVTKGLAAPVEGAMATAPVEIAALASPAMTPLVDAVIGAALPSPPPPPPVSNEGVSK
jgi:hypothetical protein